MNVERVQREVIERKLLAALDDETKAAILVTKQDLEDLVFACGLRNFRDADRAARLKELSRGMQRLINEAFPQ